MEPSDQQVIEYQRRVHADEIRAAEIRGAFNTSLPLSPTLSEAQQIIDWQRGRRQERRISEVLCGMAALEKA